MSVCLFSLYFLQDSHSLNSKNILYTYILMPEKHACTHAHQPIINHSELMFREKHTHTHTELAGMLRLNMTHSTSCIDTGQVGKLTQHCIYISQTHIFISHCSHTHNTHPTYSRYWRPLKKHCTHVNYIYTLKTRNYFYLTFVRVSVTLPTQPHTYTPTANEMMGGGAAHR